MFYPIDYVHDYRTCSPEGEEIVQLAKLVIFNVLGISS